MASNRSELNAAISNETEENEAAENASDEKLTFSLVNANVEECKLISELEGKGVEKLDDDQNKLVAEMNGDNKAESEENTFDDDEINDGEHTMSGEDEENTDLNNEERVDHEFDFSDEEDTEEDYEDDLESSEEDDDELQVSENEDDKDENAQDEKEIPKQDPTEAKAKPKAKAKAKEDASKADEHNMTKLEESLKTIKKSSKISKKKTALVEKSKKVDPVDKPEPSRKRKAKKRVESMGMIFMCSSETKNDCYQYKVFGLPESKKADVEKIYTGMRLFLYDVDLKLMYGIYKAAGPGGYNIKPKAFKSQYPSQVRFKVLDDCLPLAEEKFRKVIKSNYYTKTKFDCKLNSEQVKNLCKLFIASSKGHPTKRLGKSLKAEKHPVQRGKLRRVRAVREREEGQFRGRPRKRLRKVISPAHPLHQRPLPAPLPSTAPSYVYVRASDVDAYRGDPYTQRGSSYRDRHDPLLIRRDPYGDRQDALVERSDRYRDPPIERNDHYRDGRDSYLDSHYAYRDARDPYLERRDDLDPYPRRRNPYVEVVADLYKDRLDTAITRHDSYRDGRDPYLESRLLYRDFTRPELYSSYRRDVLTDSRDVYRGDRGVEYRRRDEVLDRYDIDSRDSYVPRAPYADPVYSADYPSRASIYRL